MMLAASGAVKGWMATSLVLETSLTVITWSIQPLPFQIWSVACLIVDGLVFLRECLLRPVGQTKPQPIYSQQPMFNMGVLM